MKKYVYIIAVSFILIFCFSQCKKQDNTPTNIVLYDKPLSTIQHYIQGKWRFVYGKGGLSSNTMYYCDNCFIEFTSNNKFIQSNSIAKTNDTTSIQWVKDINHFANNDSTYLMTFKELGGGSYIIERIYNDTLIYHDNSSEAVYYHYIKSN